MSISTDIGCEPSKGISYSTVVVRNDAPSTVFATTACERDTGRVGSTAIFPLTRDDEATELEVVMAIDRPVEECVGERDPDRRGCIASRRSLHFVPNVTLRLPVVMRIACDAVVCERGLTCVDGACMPDTVSNLEACEGPDGCDESQLDDAGARPPRHAPPLPPVPDAAPPPPNGMEDWRDQQTFTGRDYSFPR